MSVLASTRTRSTVPGAMATAALAVSLALPAAPALARAGMSETPRHGEVAARAYATLAKVGGMNYQACYDPANQNIHERLSPARPKKRGYFEGHVTGGGTETGQSFAFSPGTKIQPYFSGPWGNLTLVTISIELKVKGHKVKKKTFNGTQLATC